MIWLHVADIYDKIQEEVSAKGLDTECLGGGRIQHDAQNKKIHVYGYSQVDNFSQISFIDSLNQLICILTQGFGLADHAQTVELLKSRYPDYASITWANEGY